MTLRKWAVLAVVAAALGVVGPGAMPGVFAEPAAGDLKTQTVKLSLKSKRVGENRDPVDLTIKLIQLPPGKVVLTDKEGKRVEHEVKAVWMMPTEVTWNQYDIFWMALDVDNPWQEPPRSTVFGPQRVDGRSRPSKPYSDPARGWGRDGFPALGVSRLSALQYCAWLSAVTGKKFRLPTEAEWEYACRAGGAVAKLDRKALDEVAWHVDNSDDQAHKVAQKRPNAWGFYDMLGNVAEHLAGEKEDLTKGVVAGGSFHDEVEDVHPARRERFSEAWRRDDPQEPKGLGWLPSAPWIGVRVVMEE